MVCDVIVPKYDKLINDCMYVILVIQIYSCNYEYRIHVVDQHMTQFAPPEPSAYESPRARNYAQSLDTTILKN